MKIALLSEKYTPDPGGLAISAGRMAGLLSEAGHGVHVFAPTLNLPASENRTLVSQGITITRFGAHRRWDDTLVDWFELLLEEHRREPFELLHAYFLTGAGFVATYAGQYLRLPSIVSARGNDLDRAIFDPGRFGHVFYCLQHASAVTSNARELARRARALLPGLEVTVIPNGIDTEHFKPLPRNNALAESLSLMNGAHTGAPPRVIGFVGELREKKGLRPLLVAHEQLSREMPVILLIVGEIRAGEDRQFFEEHRHLYPAARVIVTGYVAPCDLPAYYSLMDVALQPSLRDGLPNALLEAMACGKAVVATRVGGILDAVIDCGNGRLVSSNNSDELACTIRELLNDEELRNRLGAAACQTIHHRFTLRAELEANLEVYRRVRLKM